MNTQTKAIIFCAPSGAGKTTITKATMAAFSSLSFSTSCTTRQKRDGEVEGTDYYFLTVEEFNQKIKNDEFVEHEQNYGNFYGTLKSEVERLHKEDKVIVFDVDVRGAVNLKKYFGDHSLLIFIKVPIELLEKRLRERGTETQETLAARLSAAKKEMEYLDDADVVIENIDLPKAIIEARKAVLDFLQTSL